jgi:hypothetical protein
LSRAEHFDNNMINMTVAMLLHLLMFAYWLGGDIGAFYASTLVCDPTRPALARAAAGRILNNVDMAPRTAMTFALPTGVYLASAYGYLSVSTPALVVLWALSLLWLAAVWKLHLSHAGAKSLLRRSDLAVRWLLLTALILVALLGITGRLAVPLFIDLKLLILAAAMVCGLIIRALLAPFIPAFIALVTAGPSPEGDEAIQRSLAKCRPMVVLIWVLIITAAALGIARPA